MQENLLKMKRDLSKENPTSKILEEHGLYSGLRKNHIITPEAWERFTSIISGLSATTNKSGVVTPPPQTLTLEQLEYLQDFRRAVNKGVQDYTGDDPSVKTIPPHGLFPMPLYENWFNESADGSEHTNRLTQAAIQNHCPEKGKTFGYLNYKSHFIFTPEKMVQTLLETFGTKTPDVFALAEALVPVKLAEKAQGCVVVNLEEELDDDTVMQPFPQGDPNCGPFALFKRERNIANQHKAGTFLEDGTQVMTGVWKNVFVNTLGYKFAVFANPSDCPWNKNWGNLILLKEQPTNAYVEQLQSVKDKSHFFTRDYGKSDENRCAVVIELDDGTVFISTHLEDKNQAVRMEQTLQILALINDERWAGRRVMLVGDLNEIWLDAYGEVAQRVLQSVNFGGAPLPTEALRSLVENVGNPSRCAELLTKDVRHESVFCKNVCHWIVFDPTEANETRRQLKVYMVHSRGCGDHSLSVAL